jgi:hypothetical protein
MNPMARRYFAARRDSKRDDESRGRFAMRDAGTERTLADWRRKNTANRFFELRRQGLAAGRARAGALRSVKPADR